MTDKPTLKTLNERVDGLAATVERFRRPEWDDDAAAIDRCVRALDKIRKDGERISYSYSTGGNGTSGQQRVATVLSYLRQRYGLPDPSADATRWRLEAETLRDQLSQVQARLAAVQQAADGAYTGGMLP